MKPLSREEEEFFADLERNFEDHVARYRKEKEQQLKEGKRAELEDELLGLEWYSIGVHRGQISDMLINIRFCDAKVFALRELLDADAEQRTGESTEGLPGRGEGLGQGFGFSLFLELLRQRPQGNLVVSPLSVSLAMAVAANGARGKTGQAMERILGVDDLSELNRTNAALLSSLKDVEQRVTMLVANSLWAHHEFEFRSDFMRRSQDLYGADVATLDLGDLRAVETMNGWVHKKTDGRIAGIVDESVLGTALVIVNAVYFKGAWTEPFERRLTKDVTFTLADGSTKEHPLMFEEREFEYLRGPDFQAVILPYGYGRFRMYVFLPDHGTGLGTFFESLDAEHWDRWMELFETKSGTVALPRFRVEYGADLVDTLSALGLEVAFDRTRANFAGMVVAPRAWISAVKHKTYLSVNEKGSEAAAATAVETEAEAAERPEEEEPFTMIVDRPFFCTIRDSETGALLFMAAIADPQDADEQGD